MSDTNDQLSDTSSDINWPIDHPIAQQHVQHDRVVFENVADQYVKGEDVTAFFTILQDIKVNPDVDQVGLLRVGCTKISECLAWAPAQFNPSTTSGATRHGTAVFPSASLPVTDDEFYQFCYTTNKTKNIGSSIPFQLNCASDDIDLLTNVPVRKTANDGLIALADQDNDDIVVIHTKRMLTEEKLRQENRQLLDTNRRLELQKDECQAKIDLLELKAKEHIGKVYNEMQTLTASHRTAIDELLSRQQMESKLRTECDASRSLCKQYQTESVEHAERCRALEEAQALLLSEISQTRSQLAVTSQLTKDQATQIIDVERRLMQASELTKAASQRQATLEQQMRDYRLTSEKHELSLQGQLHASTKEILSRDEQIRTLERTKTLLEEEINALRADNQSVSIMSKDDKQLVCELQEQIETLQEQHRLENHTKQYEMESIRTELNEINGSQQAYMTLKSSFTEIEKRCVKHQKNEIELKRQLTEYKSFMNDLQREIQDLTERLAAGADEYKTLFRKHTALERTLQTHGQEEPINANTTTVSLTNDSNANEEELLSLLRNAYQHQQEEKSDSFTRTTIDGVEMEIRECPMCYWEFPVNMSIETKRDHIEQHFA